MIPQTMSLPESLGEGRCILANGQDEAACLEECLSAVLAQQVNEQETHVIFLGEPFLGVALNEANSNFGVHFFVGPL